MSVWRRRGLLQALAGIGAAFGLTRVAAAPPRQTPMTYEYTYLSDFNRFNEVMININRTYAPRGWELEQIFLTVSGGEYVWHALMRRPRDQETPPESAFEYAYLANVASLGDVAQEMNRRQSPNGWSIFQTLTTIRGTDKVTLWHVVLRKPRG